MPTIAIYHDAGVSQSGLQKLLHALDQDFLNEFTLKRVDRHFFLQEHWESELALLIFPGGRDLPYHEALRGEPNARIRHYVSQGGRYLGICAGAYYGAASIQFDRGGAQEIVGERELAFFPGIAVGPVYQEFVYESEIGARMVQVDWRVQESRVYFNGGCRFEGSHYEIVATYSELPDQPPAIVYCPYGRGAALLSGVHPEYEPNDPLWPFLVNKILT